MIHYVDQLVKEYVSPSHLREQGRSPSPSVESPKLYVMGSLRNPQVKEIGVYIRKKLGWEVFDDWNAASPDADDAWKAYEEARGRTYIRALKGHAAQQVFTFDKKHLDKSTHGLLVLPAGRSAHMEVAYLVGLGKRTVILLDETYDRWDVMYNFVTAVVDNVDDAVEALKSTS